MTARVIAVDWSGARQGAARKIWLAEFRGGQPFDVPRNKMDRSDVLKYLLSTCAQYPETVVGIDFAFSFPSWFIADQKCRTAEEVWRHVERNGEQWLEGVAIRFGESQERKIPVDQKNSSTERQTATSTSKTPARSLFFRLGEPEPWARAQFAVCRFCASYTVKVFLFGPSSLAGGHE